MKQKLIITIVILVIAVGGGYWLYQRGTYGPAVAPTSAPTPAPAAAPSPTPAASGGETHTISLDTNGFNPNSLTIKTGDSVIFKNDDARERWPASGIHPTHLLCPGFDALKPLQPGETYSHTFTTARECPMHDHLNPSLRGKITVTE